MMTFWDSVTSNRGSFRTFFSTYFAGKADLVSGTEVSGPPLLQRVDEAVSRVGDQINYSMPR